MTNIEKFWKEKTVFLLDTPSAISTNSARASAPYVDSIAVSFLFTANFSQPARSPCCSIDYISWQFFRDRRPPSTSFVYHYATWIKLDCIRCYQRAILMQYLKFSKTLLRFPFLQILFPSWPAWQFVSKLDDIPIIQEKRMSANT